MDEFDEKMTSSPKPKRLRFPKQLSNDSVGSTMSGRSSIRFRTRGVTRRGAGGGIMGAIRNTFRKKKSSGTKLILKRNEFLQYSTRHIRELETALEYFREGFKKE